MITEKELREVDPSDVPDDLNPGIRRTVMWLRMMGYQTCDSGDGRTHDHACDRDHAYVVMMVEPERLVERARELIIQVGARGVVLGPMSMDLNQPCMQASYDPLNNIATLDLMGVDDVKLALPENS